MDSPPRLQPEAAPLRQRASTPWRIGITLYPYRHFYGPADKDGFCPAIGSCVTALGEAYDVANAAFIVEAVNSHAALQARVEELTKALDTAWEEINALGGSDVQDNSYDQGIVDTVAKALEIIERAKVLPLEKRS